MLFSPDEYARHRNCHPNAVTLGIQQKRLVLVDGKIESEIADKIWTPGQPAPDEGRGSKTPHAAETRTLLNARTDREFIRIERERFQVKLRELEYLQKTGKLVLKSQVEETVFNLFRALRDGMLNIPERLSGVLAAEADERVVYQTLRGEIERVLLDFTERRERAEGVA